MTAKKPNAERGVAIVEAALTLLLLFIFLFGLMEVSLLISVQQALTNAAREGARARVAPYSQTSYLADAFVVKEAVCSSSVRHRLRATRQPLRATGRQTKR